MRTIELGGRQFKALDFARRTVLQDHYLQRYLRQVGADSVLPAQDEPHEAYLVRLQTHIIDSGKAPQLVAGFLLPLDKDNADFSAELAADTARHIERCNTQDDRDQVVELVTEVAFGFFRQGLEQWARSRASMTAGPESPGASDRVH